MTTMAPGRAAESAFEALAGTNYSVVVASKARAFDPNAKRCNFKLRLVSHAVAWFHRLAVFTGERCARQPR